MRNRNFLLLLGSTLAIMSCTEKPPESLSNDSTTKVQQIGLIVKKSSSGVCHDDSSASFTRTKKFTSYSSMELCVSSGGRPYKNYKSNIDLAEQEAIDENRSFVSLYNRDEWRHWIDSDSDCQNTRHELLISTSSRPVKFKTDNECNVLTGSWYDPYSGQNYSISKDLDLDHVVPLKFANGHGGDKWSREKKQKFANDLDNLLLVSASLNRQKGAKGLDEWLPPNHVYRCEYITHFNTVMAKYGLIYIPAEQRIVDKMMKACM
jgi:hypothetical protein